jgi:hypothetical protein
MRQISLNDTLHEKILQCVADDLSAILNNTLKQQPQLTQSEQLAMLFSNFRVNKDRPWGLRLTAIGNKLLGKHYNHYRYEHNDSVNHRVLIELDKNMKWPYYLTRSHVVFYSEEDAAWFRLNGNSLSQYVDYI